MEEKFTGFTTKKNLVRGDARLDTSEIWDDRISKGLCGHCGVPVSWDDGKKAFIDEKGRNECESSNTLHQG